jgi:hypothetical protein
MTFELYCTHFSGEQLKAIADVLPNEIYLVLLLNEMILSSFSFILQHMELVNSLSSIRQTQ